jgi:hypothetical protein
MMGSESEYPQALSAPFVETTRREKGFAAYHNHGLQFKISSSPQWTSTSNNIFPKGPFKGVLGTASAVVAQRSGKIQRYTRYTRYIQNTRRRPGGGGPARPRGNVFVYILISFDIFGIKFVWRFEPEPPNL